MSQGARVRGTRQDKKNSTRDFPDRPAICRMAKCRPCENLHATAIWSRVLRLQTIHGFFRYSADGAITR